MCISVPGHRVLRDLLHRIVTFPTRGGSIDALCEILDDSEPLYGSHGEMWDEIGIRVSDVYEGYDSDDHDRRLRYRAALAKIRERIVARLTAAGQGTRELGIKAAWETDPQLVMPGVDDGLIGLLQGLGMKPLVGDGPFVLFGSDGVDEAPRPPDRRRSRRRRRRLAAAA